MSIDQLSSMGRAPAGRRQPTGVVDISGMTPAEVEAFVAGDAAIDHEIRIQRRGDRTFLVTG